jgi:hypothetical protein
MDAPAGEVQGRAVGFFLSTARSLGLPQLAQPLTFSEGEGVRCYQRQFPRNASSRSTSQAKS